MSESDVKTKREMMESNRILQVVTGSRAIGMDIETSDHDHKAIFIPPIDYYFGLKSTSQTWDNFSTKSKVKGSKSHITELEYWSLHHLFAEGITGQSNFIDILFVRPEDILFVNDIGAELLENRHIFLSKRVFYKFRGYARGVMGEVKKKFQSGSFDYKGFAIAARLLMGGTEILKTGDYHTYRPEAETLKGYREGFHEPEAAFQIIDALENSLTVAYENSHLPDAPDINRVNDLLISLTSKQLLGVSEVKL